MSIQLHARQCLGCSTQMIFPKAQDISLLCKQCLKAHKVNTVCLTHNCDNELCLKFRRGPCDLATVVYETEPSLEAQYFRK